ncbi:UMP kinase [Candidatus Bathyarchaeota archaeon]|nr:UMP kinase [Candidatus Bathyarchaeota archaeon]MBS7630917.1 UMP kinase [Candidatus Bathyarchaeota archaeon]
MRVSISLGGSLLTKNQGAKNYLKYARALRELNDRGHKIVVVCGGGRPARDYIEVACELDAPREVQDRIGILATHVNALLLIAALGRDADPRIHRTSGEVRKHLDDKILVGGGHMPGSSTDYRTVLFGRAINAELIVNATDYGGVFDKDPSRNPDAKKYQSLTYDLLEKIIRSRFKQVPGDYGLFDLKALKLAEKHRMRIVFVDGTDPEEIIRAVEGGHSGTVVSEHGLA